MHAHAFAPNTMPAPALWIKRSWVSYLNVSWDDLGGIDLEEIGLLAEMANLWEQARGLISRVHGKGGA